MQKKILLSLLVASPATLPAVANINYGHGTWESSGMASGDNVSIDNTQGNVSCVLGNGPTKWIAVDLLPGNYKLTFNTINNLSVTVSQNGKDLATVSNKDIVEFEIKTAGDVTITANGITADPYSFTGAQLQLVFDFQAVAAGLTDQIDAIAPFETITDEAFAGAGDLLKDKADLEGKIEGYKKNIEEINATKDPVDYSADIKNLFTEYGLTENPTKISTEIAEVSAKVDAWNKKAQELNEKIQRTADNNAAKEALVADQNKLLKAIGDLIDNIEAGSNYASGLCLDNAQALKSEIEAYGKAIETAYADPTQEITFTSKYDELNSEITVLTEKWELAEKDNQAYQTFMNVLSPKFQNAYNDAKKAIDALTGLEGTNVDFQTQKDAAKAEIKGIFDTAKADLNIISAEGAAELLPGDTETVDKAIADMNEKVNTITTLIETQNANKEAAAETIKGFNDEVASYDDITIPASLQADFDKAVKDINTKISALSDYVDENYEAAKLDLTANDYTTQVTAIEDALAALEKLVGPAKAINDLTKDFEDVEAYIKEKSETLGTEFIDLYGLFNTAEGTFESIKNAISKLTTQEEVDAQKEAIEDAIKNAKTTADNLFNAFTDLKTANEQYKTDVADLLTFANAKVEIGADGKDATVLKKAFIDGPVADFQKAQEEFAAEISKIAQTENPQNLYNQAVEFYNKNVTVNGEEVTYSWQSELNETKLTFAKEVTDSNKANLDAILQKAKDYVAEGTYAGQDTIDFAEIDAEVANIAAAIADATTTEAYGDADEDIVNLLPKIGDIEALAKKYKRNQEDYETLLAKLGNPGLEDDIEKLKAANEKSSEPAKSFFAEQISDIETDYNNLKDTLETAYNALDVTAQFNDIDQNIGKLSEKITQKKNDIENNNFYHTQQLNKAEDVAGLIQQALDKLEEYYENQSGIDSWYEATKDELMSLRDNDLFDANVAVANAYGVGKSYTQNVTLMAAYETIEGTVNGIIKAMFTDFEDAVVKANEKVVADADWKAQQDSMNQEYVSAITTYNSYYYGLKNVNWKAAVLEVVERHEDLYQYSQQINQLIADVNAYISSNNAKPTTFTAEDFAAVATDKVNALIAEMQAKVDALNTQIAALAETYYTDSKDASQTLIDNYTDKLTAAGIDLSNAPELTTATGALADAAAKYTKAEANTANEPLGIAMDNIADDLDKAENALNGIDLQAIAENAWAGAYSEAAAEANEIRSDLENDPNGDYKFADGTVLAIYISRVNNMIDQMSNLNTTVTGVTENLIDQYAGYYRQLQNYISSIRRYQQTVKNNSNTNEANKNLYNDLIGTTIPDLTADYEALVKYSQTLAGGQTYDASGIKTAIDDLKAFVETNSGTLTSKKTQIDSKIAAIESNITGGYKQIGFNEYAYLNGDLLNKVKVAFNDAKAAYYSEDPGVTSTLKDLDKTAAEQKLNDWNDEIDELIPEVTKLNTLINGINDSDEAKENFQAEAQKLETALTNLYVTLEQTWTGTDHNGDDPTVDVIAKLQEKYDEVAKAIADALDYLGSCHEGLDTTEFKDALDAATSALDAEKADWESVGNRVISMQTTYSDAMDEIADNVADTLAAAKAANEKAIQDAETKAANDAAYADLSEELDTLKNDLKRVSELAEEWYEGEYAGAINSINTLIEAAQTALDDANEKEQLTEGSTLLNGTAISNAISNLEYNITNRKAEDTRKVALQALSDAQSSLYGHLVPDVLTELKTEWTDLYSAYSENYDNQVKVDVTVAGLNTVIEEYNRIAEEAASLKAKAVENTYVPGNVDLDPKGLVTAADVQMLIGWILDGTTWQELYEENPVQAYAADLNGDFDLNITDVTRDIAAVFGEDVSARKLSRFAAPAYEPSTGIGVMLVSEADGVRRYAVTLDNTMPIIAGQLDLRLPSGMRIAGISTAERTSGHELQSKENSDMTRVVIYSMDNAEFEATTGAILYVDVEGRGELGVESVVLTDTYFNTHMIETKGTSFVDSVIENAKDMGTRIYNAAGMMFNKLQKGINIIRDSNGKVRKEYNRK